MHPHLTDQPSTGAPTGQTLAQFPQEMQVSASISYLFSPSLIAFTGQFAAQAPQEMQSSVILYAMFFSPPKYIRGLPRFILSRAPINCKPDLYIFPLKSGLFHSRSSGVDCSRSCKSSSIWAGFA